MNADQQAAQDRKEIKVSRASNGYIVRAWPKVYVFTTFEQVSAFLKVELDSTVDPEAFKR